jgi:hypothetical protein
MPRIYDATYDEAARAEESIQDAYEKGEYVKVIRYIETLMGAGYDFEVVASEWKELAQKYENLLVEEGRL